jgi:hypothetical protein
VGLAERAAQQLQCEGRIIISHHRTLEFKKDIAVGTKERLYRLRFASGANNVCMFLSAKESSLDVKKSFVQCVKILKAGRMLS